MEPPICWAVFTLADATPASCGSTPAVAVLIAGPKISPNPIPKMMRYGRTELAYELWTPRRCSINREIDAKTMPPGSNGFGPNRSSKIRFASWATTISAANHGEVGHTSEDRTEAKRVLEVIGQEQKDGEQADA